MKQCLNHHILTDDIFTDHLWPSDRAGELTSRIHRTQNNVRYVRCVKNVQYFVKNVWVVQPVQEIMSSPRLCWPKMSEAFQRLLPTWNAVSLTFSLWICFYMWNTGRHLNMRGMPFFCHMDSFMIETGWECQSGTCLWGSYDESGECKHFRCNFWMLPKAFFEIFFSVSKSWCAECKSGL